MKFETIIFFLLAFDIMSTDKINQNLKFLVKGQWYIIYSALN